MAMALRFSAIFGADNQYVNNVLSLELPILKRTDSLMEKENKNDSYILNNADGACDGMHVYDMASV
ncbi:MULTISPECIES: hypothetical protein [Saccharospirillaceae]|uniref:hypothetical protein n=1 Tax=Saccharospirillaceae TaxID=255527 RepID=UPI00362363CE